MEATRQGREITINRQLTTTPSHAPTPQLTPGGLPAKKIHSVSRRGPTDEGKSLCISSACCSRCCFEGIRLVLLGVRRHPDPQQKRDTVSWRQETANREGIWWTHIQRELQSLENGLSRRS